MLSLPPAAVLDANVLFPATLRDLLLNLSEAGLLSCYWSSEILDETFRNIAARRPDLSTLSSRATARSWSAPSRGPRLRAIQRRSPDELVCELIDTHDAEAICAVLRKQAAEKTRPPMTVIELLDRLAGPSQGLTTAVARLRPVCR